MSLVASEFLLMLRNFRIVWLAGRFGGGKTAFATILAAYALSHGWVEDVIANYPCAIANPAPTPPVRNSLIILDESWQFARDSRAIQKYGAYLRKLGNFLILPSVFPVSSNLSLFRAERVFNAYVVGIPAWIWRWWLQQRGYTEKGYFAVIRPHEVFPLYDSYSVDTSDGAIADLLSATIELTAKKDSTTATSPHLKSHPKPQPQHEQLSLPGLNDVADELAATSANISEATVGLQEALERFARRLRR